MSDTLPSLLQKLHTALARNNYDEAIDLCTQIINHPDADDEQRATVYYNRGNTYNDKGDYDRAIQDYDKAIELRPNDADAYCNRGNVYNNKNEYDLAIQDLDKALELNSKNAIAYYNRGIAYGGNGENDRAIQDYNRAIEADPNFAMAYYNCGNEYLYKEKFNDAIQYYDKAIKIDPNHTEAIHNRGVAMALRLSKETQKKVSDKYEKELREQQEKFERNLKEKVETHKGHTLDEYIEREKKYKIQREELEKEQKFFLSKLSLYAAIWYPAAIGGYFVIVLASKAIPFLRPLEFSVLAPFSLILTVTLALSPIAWRIRILNRRIEKLRALEEHSYSNYQLVVQLVTAKNDDPEIKKELLKKFFDHHDKRGSSQLIADWDRTTEKDSNDNIIQTIIDHTSKAKDQVKSPPTQSS